MLRCVWTDSRESEIAYFNAVIFLNQDVIWLEIPVENVPRVQKADSFKEVEAELSAYFFCDDNFLLLRQIKILSKTQPVHVFHYYKDIVACGISIRALLSLLLTYITFAERICYDIQEPSYVLAARSLAKFTEDEDFANKLSDFNYIGNIQLDMFDGYELFRVEFFSQEHHSFKALADFPDELESV